MIGSLGIGVLGSAVILLEHGSPVLDFVALENGRPPAGQGMVPFAVRSGDLQEVDKRQLWLVEQSSAANNDSAITITSSVDRAFYFNVGEGSNTQQLSLILKHQMEIANNKYIIS